MLIDSAATIESFVSLPAYMDMYVYIYIYNILPYASDTAISAS